MRARLAIVGVVVGVGCGAAPDGDAASATEGATATATGGSTSPSTASGSTGGTAPTATGGTAAEGTEESGSESSGGETPPPPAGMPAGIPMPEFGYRYDTDLPATIVVDNSDPDCDDAVGSEAAPLCDLFAGGDTGSWVAGDVVEIRGGPYVISGDKALSFAGTPDSPVVLRAAQPVRLDAQGNRADFSYAGTYAIIENIDFYHRTRHTIEPGAHHLVFRGIEVHNPKGEFIDFNPVVQIAGSDIVIYESRIYDNRRDNDTDSHGINAGSGSSNLWILDSEFFNNNGDAFQGCHECFANPPHHVYIGRNEMHEDRENAVDLKTIHDVVVSENVMYGYAGSGTSSGDAMVIGSNGYDDGIGQGPRRVWVLGNEFRDSTTGVRIEGVEDAWIIGNLFTGLGGGLQIDNKEYRNLVVAGNVFDGADAGIYSWNDSCSADSVRIENNIVGNITGRDIELPDCDNATLASNLLWDGVTVRVGGQNFTTAAELDAQPYASGTLDVAPQFDPGSLRPADGSPAIDAGVSLDVYETEIEDAYGGDAHKDLTGAPRPAGTGYDIGAYER